MPCDYSKYHPKWKLISRLIRFKRANNCCEKCGVKNGTIIKRMKDGTWREPSQVEWDMIYSRIKNKHSNMTESLKYHRFTKVVLTVAHLDQDKNNNRFWNLAALCQKCHLKHDIKQHSESRKYGRDFKGSQQTKMNL